MSGNSESIPLAIECFMDEIDVSGRIKRFYLKILNEILVEFVDEILSNVKIKTKVLNAKNISDLIIMSKLNNFQKFPNRRTSSNPS